MTLFSLGFGYSLNYGLLDGMAKQNDGLARRIYEDSDAALQLQVNYTDTPKEPFITCQHDSCLS